MHIRFAQAREFHNQTTDPKQVTQKMRTIYLHDQQINQGMIYPLKSQDTPNAFSTHVSFDRENMLPLNFKTALPETFRKNGIRAGPGNLGLPLSTRVIQEVMRTHP